MLLIRYLSFVLIVEKDKHIFLIDRQIHDCIYGYESLEDSTSEEECYLILNKQEVMSIINFFLIVYK